jgi:hypothetical protein
MVGMLVLGQDKGADIFPSLIDGWQCWSASLKGGEGVSQLIWFVE